jgi:hypothetical protein
MAELASGAAEDRLLIFLVDLADESTDPGSAALLPLPPPLLAPPHLPAVAPPSSDGGAGARRRDDLSCAAAMARRPLLPPPPPTPLPCQREELRWRPELNSELRGGVDGAGGARETAMAGLHPQRR